MPYADPLRQEAYFKEYRKRMYPIQKTKYSFVCTVCGEAKTSAYKEQTFCSLKCFNFTKRVIKNCVICDKQFRSYRQRLKFCSKSCSRKGENNPMWIDGRTPENLRIRHSIEYNEWRKAVFTRDKFTCVLCGDTKGGNLEADHIKPFSLHQELRFAVTNGRTLCKPCHNKYGWKYRPSKKI